MTYEEGYHALTQGVGALDWERDFVRVSGPDAERYLQGQLSQDIAALGPGAWAWALVLAPQGKLDAFVRVYRTAPDEFVLDTDAGVGPALVARLLRFRLRTKADVEPLEWRAVAVRGPGAAACTAATSTAVTSAAVASASGAPGGDVVAVPFRWGTLTGYDLLGTDPVAPDNAVAATTDAYEAARVEAGFPRHGAELDDRTIPAEAGLVAASVSFTKGCYTGQELVARIDSRGSNVPRCLRGLLLSGPAAPGERLYRSLPSAEGLPDEAQAPEGPAGAGPEAAGAPEAKEVGRLTSVARSPERGWVALGYVGRAVVAGENLVVAGGPGSGAVRAEVSLLPFSSDGRSLSSDGR